MLCPSSIRAVVCVILSVSVVGEGSQPVLRASAERVARDLLFPLRQQQATVSPSIGSAATVEKRFPFPAGGEVRVENPRGRILVFEGAPDQLRIVAEGSKAPVSAADLRIEHGKTTVEIKCVAKEERVVDLHLAVPAGVKLRLKAEEGTIQVHGRVAGVRAETLSGDVILGIPVEDAKIEITWLEGYPRYGGPPLERSAAPALLNPAQRGAAPPPAMLVGKLGSGRLPIQVRTLNGWVEVGTPTSTAPRTLIGAVPPQPLSHAARTIASSPQNPLGVAIRYIEPRLQRALAQADWLAGGKVPVGSSTDDEEVVKLESPLVTLNASVTDAEGKVITGLTAKDFAVTEDGVPQPITHFSRETAPFNLVLLLDVSGSTRGSFDVIRQAALRFVELMRPEDRLAIILFARDVEVAAHLTGDRQALTQALYRVEPPLGSTAVYDAIGYALVEEIGRVRGQRNAIVVLSDGRDSSMAYLNTPLANDPLRRPGSFLRFEDLLNGVIQSDALIYPILLENEAQLAATLIESAREQVREGTRLAEQQFRQLADVSGGRLYRAAKLEDLDGVYEQIAADLRTIYSLAYMPTRAERDGRWRQVEVTVARPGARVRTRRGYFAQ